MLEQTGPPVAKSEHFYGMQILRGLAALLVVLDHSGEVATRLLKGAAHLEALHVGAFGVDLFFPISGFVIFVSASSMLRRHAGKQGLWQDFARRRIIRVVPVYWISTTVKLLTLVLIPSAVTQYRFELWNAISSYLFIFSFNNDGLPRPVLPIGWTLNYEMFFYLIVGLALYFRVSILLWTSAVLLILTALHPFLPTTYAVTAFTDPIVLEFLGGMLLAFAVPQLRKIPGILLLALSAASAWFALVHIHGTLELHPMRPILWGIPGLIILASVVGSEHRFPFGKLRSLLLLGDASYSIYLTHTIMLAFLAVFARKLPIAQSLGGITFVALGTVVGITVGILFHLYCELPLTKLLLGKSASWSIRSAETSQPA